MVINPSKVSIQLMTDIKYTKFRSLHKGTPQKEISKLWKEYKAGKYELPSFEPTEQVDIPIVEPTVEKVTEEAVEEVVEEPSNNEQTPLQEIKSLCDEYNRLLKRFDRMLVRLDDEAIKAGQERLLEIANQTIPKDYKCSPTDSWKIWMGPTSECLLINTTAGMAFTVYREWWQKHYQNTIYVDRELLNNNDLIEMEIRRYHRNGMYLPRSPVVGVECQLPQGVKDIRIRGGQGIN
jgi:hypothetical protein